mmetsp:Transcript_3056/g.8061  ORF Transcript_3056/g.8061 Transcript_3056/m.8061 type:complete len:280 (+) Transcript_3056:918-1757(+)
MFITMDTGGAWPLPPAQGRPPLREARTSAMDASTGSPLFLREMPLTSHDAHAMSASQEHSRGAHSCWARPGPPYASANMLPGSFSTATSLSAHQLACVLPPLRRPATAASSCAVLMAAPQDVEEDCSNGPEPDLGGRTLSSGTQLRASLTSQDFRLSHCIAAANCCTTTSASTSRPARHFTNALSDGGSASLASAGRLSRPLLPLKDVDGVPNSACGVWNWEPGVCTLLVMEVPGVLNSSAVEWASSSLVPPLALGVLMPPFAGGCGKNKLERVASLGL